VLLLCLVLSVRGEEDACESARTISIVPSVVQGSLHDAASLPPSCGMLGSGVLYRLEVQEGIRVHATVQGLTANPSVALLGGEDCGSLSCHSGFTSRGSRIHFVPRSSVAWIAVVGDDPTSYMLQMHQGDETSTGCDDAKAIEGPYDPPVTFSDGLMGVATPGEGMCGQPSAQEGNWYLLNPNLHDHIVVTYNSEVELTLALLSGSSCSMLSCDFAHTTKIDFTALEAEYYLYVSSEATNSTDSYELTVDGVNPVGSSCAHAQPLAGPTTSTGALTTEGGKHVGEMCYSAVNSPTYWFSFTPPPSTNVTVSTCLGETDFDTLLLVVAECDSCLAKSNDDDSCGYSAASTLHFLSGEDPMDLYIIVGGTDGAQGTFALSLLYD